MPLTFAHPLLVVPLRRVGLPFTALTMGAMAPDFRLFVPLPMDGEATHTLRGVFTIDVVLAAIALVVWERFLRPPVTDALPRAIRERVPPAPRRATMPSLRGLVMTAIAIVIGGLTHLAWDSFTHYGAFMVVRIPALSGDFRGMPGYEWMQYASSAVGVAALAVIVVLALRRRPAVPRPRRHPRTARAVLLAPLVLGALTAGAVGGATWGRESIVIVTYYLAVASIIVTAFALAVAALVWWLNEVREQRRPSGEEGSTAAPRMSA